MRRAATLGLVFCLALAGCESGYLEQARDLVDPAQRLWPGDRASNEEPETDQAPPDETPAAEAADAPQEKGPVSDPARIVFRYTDDEGNLKFVTGIDNVPRRHRPDVQVVDGSKLSTYQSRPVAVRTSRAQAPPKSSTLRGRPGGPWNSNQIDWVPLSQAKSRARRLQQPILLVVYTDWCPHCRDLEKQFEDQQVAALAQRVVMTRGNSDEMDELGRKYAPDGRYVPRMLILSPMGKLDPTIHDGGKSRYNWGSSSPAGILRAMQRALRKYGG